MDRQVRDARITDVDRIMHLLEASTDPFGDHESVDREAANLLRQLIYLPQAAVLVAEVGRQIVGLAVLALRPSVREGGMIGTIDVLAVDAGYDEAGIREALVNEATRSARNKGCLVLEATTPVDAAARDRWLELGFEPGEARLTRAIGRATAVRN